MIIMGFDPGLNRTGFGVIDASAKNPRYVASGIIDNPKTSTKDTHKLLAHLGQQMEQIIHKYNPQYCAVEQIFRGPYIKSNFTLAMARGVILSAIGKVGVELHNYTPTEVKKMIAGNGRASKEEVSIMMKRHLGLTGIISEDASDALAVCLCLFYYLQAA